MLKLNASYSKKIPAESEYSSQQYHASIEMELPDGLPPDELRARISETFSLVRATVENELQTTAPRQPIPATTPSNNKPRPDRMMPASNKQIAFLIDLATKRAISLEQLNADVHTRYGVDSVYRLTRQQASELIDSFGVGNGNRNRRAA